MVDLIKKLFQQLFFLFFPQEWIIAINRINYSIIILDFERKIGKFENVRIFKQKIMIMASKKERNHYGLKKIENRRNLKIV